MTMSSSQIFKLSFVVAAVISGVCQAAVYHGRVDRVVDGDTLIVTTESDQLRVRNSFFLKRGFMKENAADPKTDGGK